VSTVRWDDGPSSLGWGDIASSLQSFCQRHWLPK
jgi:hypothetical protein